MMLFLYFIYGALFTFTVFLIFKIRTAHMRLKLAGISFKESFKYKEIRLTWLWTGISVILYLIGMYVLITW